MLIRLGILFKSFLMIGKYPITLDLTALIRFQYTKEKNGFVMGLILKPAMKPVLPLSKRLMRLLIAH